MAQSVNMKPFYIALGVIAVVGGAWIWNSRAGPGSVTIALPNATAGTAFPGYVLGSDSATVEIIEYADFQCPACAAYAILTGQDVKNRLVNTGRVRIRFRDFPLPIHEKAPIAHLAAACAGEQEQFWAMHDALFFSQGTWVQDRRPDRVFEQMAQSIGLNMEQYTQCVSERRYIDRIAATRNEGVTMGVSSTPSFIIGDRMVPGSMSYDQLLQLIERAEATAPQP